MYPELLTIGQAQIDRLFFECPLVLKYNFFLHFFEKKYADIKMLCIFRLEFAVGNLEKVNKAKLTALLLPGGSAKEVGGAGSCIIKCIYRKY